jgi:hypothetical protein
VIQAQVRPFQTDINAGIAHMTREQLTVINNFGTNSPLLQWSGFLSANVRAISTFNETIDGATSKAAIKKNFDDAVKELKSSVSNAFQQAPKIENQTPACRARLVPSVNAYVYRLQYRAYSLASGETIKFINNATNERTFIRNYYGPFYRNLAICNGRNPLEQKRDCIVTLVSLSVDLDSSL